MTLQETKFNACFTPHIVSQTNPFSPWYEYCPESEQDFKEMVFAIVDVQLKKNIKIRALSINQVIRRDNLNIHPLSEDSRTEEWVNAYWELYMRNFIVIGYSRSQKMGPQIFVVKEKERAKSRIH